jgi:catechol 2,3-dioxygenase-like lactoylglutathione lyase family enzyme
MLFPQPDQCKLLVECDIQIYHMVSLFCCQHCDQNPNVDYVDRNIYNPSRSIASDHFDENRVGLDHISFSVGSRNELEKAIQEFDYLGIPHGEIKNLGGLGILVLAFRDPDNIQLELTAPVG